MESAEAAHVVTSLVGLVLLSGWIATVPTDLEKAHIVLQNITPTLLTDDPRSRARSLLLPFRLLPTRGATGCGFAGEVPSAGVRDALEESPQSRLIEETLRSDP